MQQEGAASVFLPRPASHVRASMLPCVEAPLSKSTALMADAGAQPTGCAGAHVLGGVEGAGKALWVKRISSLLPLCVCVCVVVSTTKCPTAVG